MILEKILFPAPNPPHYTLTSHEEKLFWLPINPNFPQIPPIPCMLYSPIQAAKFFIIWCHGNACDIGSMDLTLTTLSQRLSAYVLAFEYPSYGLLNRTASSPDETTINNHANCAYSFVRDQLQWPTDRIIIYGHSIGSGAACYLASTQRIGGLILQSPYTSINSLIQEKVGLLSRIIKCRYWNNFQAVSHIDCPILFIHGQRDLLIPSQHSERLFHSLNHIEKKQIVLLPDDDHNSISDRIIVMSVAKFFNQYFPDTNSLMPRVEINQALYEPPQFNPNTTSSSLRSLFKVSKNTTSSI